MTGGTITINASDSNGGIAALTAAQVSGVTFIFPNNLFVPGVAANTTSPVTVSNCTFDGSSAGAHSWGVWAQAAGANVTVTGNTFTSVGSAVYADAANATVIASGNTFIPPRLRIYNNAGAGMTLTSDYNNFTGAPTAYFTIGNTFYGSLADYRTATGQDANSTP